jgi:hypothetical protein
MTESFLTRWERVIKATPMRRCDECPTCEYDRQFPGFEAGGWMKQDNNGPIVSCPLCNPTGDRTPRL